MVWAKIDDAILDNPKIVAAGVYGFALHVAAISWCCRNLTDGVIPFARVSGLLHLKQVQIDSANPFALADGDSSMGGETGLDPVDVADHLVAVGLWRDVPGGYELNDFLEYNPSRESVLSERARGKKRAEESRTKTRSPETPANVRRKFGSVSGGPVPVPVPVPTETKPPVVPPGDEGFGDDDRESGVMTVAAPVANDVPQVRMTAEEKYIAAYERGIASGRADGSGFSMPLDKDGALHRSFKHAVDADKNALKGVELLRWIEKKAEQFAIYGRTSGKDPSLLCGYRPTGFLSWLNTGAPSSVPAPRTLDRYGKPDPAPATYHSTAKPPYRASEAKELMAARESGLAMLGKALAGGSRE